MKTSPGWKSSADRSSNTFMMSVRMNLNLEKASSSPVIDGEFCAVRRLSLGMAVYCVK